MDNQVFPTVHLNGTAADDLANQLADALAALQAAQQKLQLAGPNNRDYYPQGPTAQRLAYEQHVSRADRLQSVAQELAAALDNVLDQQAARRARGRN
jgi:hypothetical protein